MQLAKCRGLFFTVRNILRPLVQIKYNIKINRGIFIHNNRKNLGLLLFSFSWFSSKSKAKDEEESPIDHAKEIAAKADELYKVNKYKEVRELLETYRETSEIELLWRLSRVLYNMSQEIGVPPEEKKALIFESFDIISRSLALDETNFANHKWMSILLDARTAYDGIKARISHLQSVKNHMMTAIQLNPKDATTLYMLGLWCYQIADMPWYQRRIASTVFSTPPVSSFDEALYFFTKAEQVEPRFYSQNLLMLGKTYLKLKKDDKAKYYLDLACHYPIATDDDILANKEACEILKKINVTK